jgi:hypothetical protein
MTITLSNQLTYVGSYPALLNLDNNRFASASKDGYIRIWSSDDDFKSYGASVGIEFSWSFVVYW